MSQRCHVLPLPSPLRPEHDQRTASSPPQDKNGFNKVSFRSNHHHPPSKYHPLAFHPVDATLLGQILYCKGRVLGHKRAKRNSRPNTSLVQIEGVASKEDAQFYLGKRVAYVYRAKREIQGSKIRVIWGRVTRPHGNSGVVKSKFSSNLPPRAFGASVRIMLYPSSI
ncbi:ribosomal protein L35Ae-domain-containing protein [Boletus reticuloceps]|uniref:Ribosomal protein L35Ae-domain-containing protein n=1 Tax=Boletus reticuloceps TaxID=495285 RepID=A0A8I2YC13_9AGAM|nr:ribosomal protein L35Ae-domain-containing protein [Boletus reticuloceps]